MVPGEGSGILRTGQTSTLEADVLVQAFGQTGDFSAFDQLPGLVVADGAVQVGTDMMTGAVGVFAGVYLAERKEGKVCYLVRLCVEILHGVPSIVIGIIAYAWVVITLGTFSALAGGISLAIMMLPVIVRSTEETLKLIPDTLREASLSLGVPYYRTVLKVIMPAGMSGIATGILISVARVGGETAPLLFTAFGSPYMEINILKPVNSLPLVIFNYATSPYPEWHALAWGASFVLVAFVLLLNLSAKFLTRKWKVQF